MSGILVWNGGDEFKRVRPAPDARLYWVFLAGFLAGVAECAVILASIGGFK